MVFPGPTRLVESWNLVHKESGLLQRYHTSMLFRRFRERDVPTARSYPYRTEAGMRVYAIGDVHGCLAQLEQLLERIAADCAGISETVHLLFLGDLVDRGPDSAGVISRLRRGPLPADRVHFIMGNHEEAMLAAWRGEASDEIGWLSYGGRETLESYGIDRARQFSRGFTIYDAMRAAVPTEDMAFVETFADQLRLGDYLFVHAGIRPGIPLDQQGAADLRWIRGEFLDSDADHGPMVVHGHTIVGEPDVRRNRLGIDTGCYSTGRLTALGLSGGSAWLLDNRPGSTEPLVIARDGQWVGRT